MSRISKYTNIETWNVVTYSYPKFKCGLDKLLHPINDIGCDFYSGPNPSQILIAQDVPEIKLSGAAIAMDVTFRPESLVWCVNTRKTNNLQTAQIEKWKDRSKITSTKGVGIVDISICDYCSSCYSYSTGKTQIYISFRRASLMPMFTDHVKHEHTNYDLYPVSRKWLNPL